jgi:hypothetical protein
MEANMLKEIKFTTVTPSKKKKRSGDELPKDMNTNNAAWLKPYTADDKTYTLSDITLPASHDAGVSKQHYKRFKSQKLTEKGNIIAQHYDIENQLYCGSRYLDLRFDREYGKLKTFHGDTPIAGGGWGQSAKRIFGEVSQFLSDNPSEFVILRISHTAKSAKIGEKIIKEIPKNLRYSASPTECLAQTKLHALKGKAVAVLDSSSLKTCIPAQGLCRYWKYEDEPTKTVGLGMCGKYAGVLAGRRKVTTVTIEACNRHVAHAKTIPRTHLFMAYWQRAFHIEGKTVIGKHQYNKNLKNLDLKKGMHYNLPFLLNIHRGHVSQVTLPGDKPEDPGETLRSSITLGNMSRFRPNIINLDFIDIDVCNLIIEFNDDLR